MPRPPFAILSLVAVLAATTGAKAVDKDKLRQAACLPQLSGFRNFRFSTATGFSLDLNEAPLSEQIAALHKTLKTDPTNAEANIRLGSLYEKTGHLDESKDAYTKAVELCRQRFVQNPNNNSWRLTLAEALQGLSADDEAETLLRQAVKDAPTSWKCWLALAEYLGTKSTQTIMGNKPWHYNSPETLLQAIRAAQPTKERISASQPYRKEAAVCFERAIALVPRESKIYRRRIRLRTLLQAIDCGLRMYTGEKVDPAEFYLFPADAREDLQRIADLDANDYVAIAAATFFEMSAVVFTYQSKHPNSKPPVKLIDVSSEATRKRLSENLKRLEKGMRDPDKHKAAMAAEFLGTFQMAMLEDEQAAEKSFRRCLELDPGRDDAWEMLTAMLACAQRYPEVLELSRCRVRHKDSAHNRLFLAKAYEYLNQLDRAEGEIREGLKREPDDFMLNLALADIFLMSNKADDLERAGDLLCKAAKSHDPGAIGENRWVNYTYACGIFYGLRGDVEKARRSLDEVQRRMPEILPVKEALLALDDSFEPVASPPLPGRSVPLPRSQRDASKNP